jgi:hypothetical protein
VAAGTGSVYSYVVHRHPPLPGRRLPVVAALVELDEGVRMVGELRDADPSAVRIGDRVRVFFDEGLPAWRPDVPELPAWELPVTPTLVIGGAIATRDYQDVHHDRDAAVRRGSRDIFLNILTTTGLVQRYVTDWAGSGAVVHGIAIRLGAPCHPGDTLTFAGRLVDDRTVKVTGTTAGGVHVSGTVSVTR